MSCIRSILRSYIPLIGQLDGYDADALRGDLAAGLTVGVMLIPQGMAYALIAGLPPIYGLYASLVPLVGYAVFGTSRQLAVGPVALVSLLVAASVGPLADGDPQRYIALSLLLALMVGALQLALGLLRFGFLVNFLSHPVLSGFTSAAALIIGFSQLKHLLGVDLPRSNHIHEIIGAAIEQIGAVHPPTLVIGLASIGLLVGLKRWSSKVPGALVAVALTTAIVGFFGLNGGGMTIVGDVPSGLPAPVWPAFAWADVQALLPGALTIAFVGFMESIAVAKVYATRNRYPIDANQELIGLGIANITGAFFQAYPTTGGFSRTAVNADAGAQTTLASVVSAGVIGLTLLFLTPLFYYMPNAVLAAIVVVAVAGLFDWKEARYLWRVDRRDLALMGITFVMTLALGIEEGILTGVVVSIIAVVYQSSKPHTAVMGRLPETTTYRNLEHYPEALTQSDVTVVRMDAELYFANVSAFKDLIANLDRESEALQALVIDMYPVNRIDSTATHTLHQIVDECRSKNVDVYLAGVKGPVHQRLLSAGVIHQIGPDHLFHEVHDAVAAAQEQIADATGVEANGQPAYEESTAV